MEIPMAGGALLLTSLLGGRGPEQPFGGLVYLG